MQKWLWLWRISLILALVSGFWAFDQFVALFTTDPIALIEGGRMEYNFSWFLVSGALSYFFFHWSRWFARKYRGVI